jgi:hypothetical protein
MEMFDGILAGTKPTGDILGIQYGIVADNQDPLKLQRVQVYDQAKGGKHKSDWLIRGLPFTSFSPPVPKVGDLVVFGYIMGDPHRGCYLGCGVNNVNKPVGLDTDNTMVLGAARITVSASGAINVIVAAVDITIATSGIVDIKGSTELNIESTKLSVKTTGDFKLEGKDLTIKGETVTYDCPNIDMGSPSSFKVGGKQITTVTAPDSRGDTLVDKGW